MISIKSFGSFDHMKAFLESLDDNKAFGVLDKYGQVGVDLLASATPIETGETAHDWGYTVTHTKNGHHILGWHNTHVEDGVNIAVILQYGHGTGTGGYVEGIDYINPALRPLFDKIIEDIWREVANA